MTTRITIICGSPRSGTTWLGKIFDSHPTTLYRHEPDSCLRHDDFPLFIPLSKLEEYRGRVQEQVAELMQVRSTKVSGKLPLFPKSYYSPPVFQLRRMIVLAAKLADRYLGGINVPDLVSRAQRSAAHLVWKSIESNGRLGILIRSLEDCRAIQIIRHPCGYVASILRGENVGGFTERQPASEDYGLLRLLLATEQARRRKLTLESMRALMPVERLAWRWVLSNEKAMSDTAGLSNCTLIRYEDLCADPKAVAIELFRFAGLPWHPQCEAFIRQSISRESSGFHSVFKNPLHSANKWKDELAPDEARRIATIARDSLPGKLFFPS